MGGYDRTINYLSSTETLKYVNERWEMSLGSYLPEPLYLSAASASRSNDIVGYLVGGVTSGGLKSKIWYLRRSDFKYVEIKKRLQIPRYFHTLLNLRSNNIPGC